MTTRCLPGLVLAVAAALAIGCAIRTSESSAITRVTRDNFQAVVIHSNKPVLLEFSSVDCGPCVAMEPHLEAVARRHGEDVVFAKVIVEQSAAIAREYDISAVPTLMVIDRGEIRARREGYLEPSQLTAMIRPYLSGE